MGPSNAGLPLMHLISVKGRPILQQLHLEERLLRTTPHNWCIINDGTIAPSIVMGISGQPDQVIEVQAVLRDRIPVIRRFSGGGTVIVDSDTIFVTLICNQGAVPNLQLYPRPIMSWTEQLYSRVFKGLADFHLREHDYTFGDRKFGGNAQSITKGRWLHHTSFLWDYKVQNMAYLKLPARTPKYRLVYLFGGHVTSWKNDRGEELLFVSSKAIFKPPKAIRGGIPICFPQFGSCGSLEQHGFARNRFWSIDSSPPPLQANNFNNKAVVDLILKPTEEDLKIWPHCFEFRLRVALAPGGDLTLISRIRNTDSKPFTFTFAYHTYFSVSDISEVRVEGLETLDYLDNLQDKERFTEQGDAITFESEVDRIYLSTPTKIAILDHEKKRTFVLKKDGLADAVVWNPWEKKAKSMLDFGDEEYKHMLCVEAAAVEKPITLKPGEEWKGRQELSAVPSSYCSGQLDPQKVLQG